MEIFKMHHLRVGYHVRVATIALEAIVGGNGHMLTKLEHPIKKGASQYVVDNSNLSLLLTSWASFDDEPLDSS